MSKDYYKILGIDKGASKEEIKKAYRKLAHKYHPDKTSGDEARFKEVNEAYQVLSNEKKRTQYDRFGSGFPGAGGQHSGMGGFDFNNVNWSDMGDMGDMSDIFEDLFQQFGGGFGGAQRRRVYNNGSDIESVINISLEEAFEGINKKVALKTRVECKECDGAGHEKGSAFNECDFCR
ncbi:MAG: DnaJ domain-containing protein, partial [Candidatus Paceibacterota bacterium]